MVAWQVISETAKSSKLLLSYWKSVMFKKFKFGHIKKKILNVHSGITYNKTMQNQQVWIDYTMDTEQEYIHIHM